jgi:predicted aminopeptidase
MSESSTLDVLSKYIPGFGAYRSEQKRRDDDLAVRQFLANRLQECKRDLQAVVVPLVDQGNFAAIQQGEKLRLALDNIQSKLRGAVEGYSSWFETVRVDEAKLKQVIDYDNDLVGVIDRIQHEITHVNPTAPDFRAALDVVAMLKERFARRSDLLAK